MLEYLLMISLVVVGAIMAIGFLGEQTSNLTHGTSTAINKSLTPAAGTNGLPVTGTLPIGSTEEDEDGQEGKGNGKKSKGKGKGKQ